MVLLPPQDNAYPRDCKTTREGRNDLAHYPSNIFFLRIKSYTQTHDKCTHIIASGTNLFEVCCSLPIVWEDQEASVVADAFQTLVIRAKVVNVQHFISVHIDAHAQQYGFYP